MREFEKNGDDKRIIFTYARIASLYIDENRIEEAGSYIEQGLNRLDGIEIHQQPMYVYLHQMNAKYCLHIQNFESAIEYSLLAAQMYEKLGLQRDSADCLQICVDAYRKKGRHEDAFLTLEKVADTLRRTQKQTYILNGGVLQ